MAKILLLSIMSLSLFAQDFSDIGFSTQKESPGQSKFHKEVAEKNTVDKPAPKECSSEDQKSLPQRDLKALMIYSGGQIEANPSAGGDYLNVGLSSPIIGNCNSMLQPKLILSKKYGKYIYEVGIRKQCEEDKCEYEVSYMDNGEKKVEKKEYEPTMSGFYQCMQDNVGIVENDGKKSWNESKIVKKEISKVTVASPETSELLFVSKGPMAMQKSAQKNKIPNNSCDFFEEVNGTGYQHFSSSDIQYRSLEKQAQALCKSNKYSDVENGLSSFVGYDGLYQTLIDVRNDLLLKEIIKERAHLQNLKSDKNLSEVDASKYNKLIQDYYDLIIDKNLSSANHTEQDQLNPDLLVNMLAEYEKALSESNYDYASSLKDKIAAKTNELAKFLNAPYFDVSDYRAMTDLGNSPNFENSDWKNATKTLHESLISLKLLCEAYGTSKKCAEEKPSNQNFKEKSTLTSLGAVQKRAKEFNDKAVDDYDDKLTLIKTPNGYKSLKYEKLLNQCETHKEVAKQYAQGIQAQVPQITQQCQAQSGNNQQALKECIERYKFQISGDSDSLKLKHENCEKMQKHYTEQKVKWEKLEAQRDDYIGLSATEKSERKTKVEKAMEKDKYEYSFKFKGVQRSTPRQAQRQGNFNFNMNGQMQGQSQRPPYATPPYQANNYSMYGPSQMYNYGQSGQGYGMQNYYGMQQGNYGMQNYRSPSYYNGGGQGGLNFGLNFGAGQNQGYSPYNYPMGNYPMNNNNSNPNGPGTSFMFNGTGAGGGTTPPTSNQGGGGFKFNFN